MSWKLFFQIMILTIVAGVMFGPHPSNRWSRYLSGFYDTWEKYSNSVVIKIHDISQEIGFFSDQLRASDTDLGQEMSVASHLESDRKPSADLEGIPRVEIDEIQKTINLHLPLEILEALNGLLSKKKHLRLADSQDIKNFSQAVEYIDTGLTQHPFAAWGDFNGDNRFDLVHAMYSQNKQLKEWCLFVFISNSSSTYRVLPLLKMKKALFNGLFYHHNRSLLEVETSKKSLFAKWSINEFVFLRK